MSATGSQFTAGRGLTISELGIFQNSTNSATSQRSGPSIGSSHILPGRNQWHSFMPPSENWRGKSESRATVSYRRAPDGSAELYPAPRDVGRPGATEEIPGEYLDRIGPSRRDDLVIATKATGYYPDSPVAAARSYPDAPIDPPPDCRLDAPSVRDAVRASLRRLRTDRIDLLQLHWPDRYVPMFGETTYRRSMTRDDDVPILETAAALRDLIDEGKVRCIGLSNESTYGVCEWVGACERLGIADRLASVQNSYSLLDRRFDSELAEACEHHGIGLLPWSVLAGGFLSGKYKARRRGNVPPPTPDSRFNRFTDFMGRWNPRTAARASLDATEEYAKIAQEAGMTPSELAIGFVRSRQFVQKNGSVILGATTMEQLKENLAPFGDGGSLTLDEDVLAKIDEVHMRCRDPCCSL